MCWSQRPQTIWHLRVTSWISRDTRAQAHAHAHAPTPTHTHTHKYVVLIAFARQQWFRERTSVVRHMNIACLVYG